MSTAAGTGPVPNYVNPETRQPLIIWANIIFNAIALLAVSLRVFSRWGILKKMYIEDWLIVAAMALAIVQAAGMCMAARYGMGLHMIDIRPEDFPKIVLWGFTFGVIYNPVFMLVRTSILLFLIRLFPQRGFKWACWGALFFVNTASGVDTLLTIFACKPIPAAWDPFSYPEAKCINMSLMAITNAIFNTLSDALLFILPLPLLFGVRLPHSQKVGLLIVFGLGVIVVVASIIRAKLVWDTSFSDEGLWDSGVSAAFSQVEIALSIVCACLPATRHALGYLFPRFFAQPTSERDYTGNTFGGSGKTGGNRSGGDKVYGGLSSRNENHTTVAAGSRKNSLSPTHSEEYILGSMAGSQVTSEKDRSGIKINTTFDVTHTRSPSRGDDEV